MERDDEVFASAAAKVREPDYARTKAPQQPTIGRIVRIFGPKVVGELCGVITRVIGEGRVNVGAFSDYGYEPMKELTFRAPGATPSGGLEWSWPPRP